MITRKLLLLFIALAALPAFAEERQGESTSSSAPSIGSWRNSPPDRPAVAFDAYFNRLYFDADGKVVGRYNRSQKKFQAGDFRPAQWHKIDGDRLITSTDDKSTSSTTTTPDYDYSSTSNSPDPTQPEFEKPKPAEVFRRGQSSAGGSSGSRVKIIEAAAP